MSNLKICIVGYSGPRLDQSLAKQLLELGIKKAIDDHVNVTSVTIATRLTHLDAVAWEIAQEKGYLVEEQFKMNNEDLIVPNDIDVIVRVGSDTWSLQQARTFQATGGTAYEYELDRLSTLSV